MRFTIATIMNFVEARLLQSMTIIHTVHFCLSNAIHRFMVSIVNYIV